MYLDREIPGLGVSPADVIHIATELGGGLDENGPRDRIVICGYNGRHLSVVNPLPMTGTACARVDRIRRAAGTLARTGLTQCALVGFGTPMFGAAHRLIDWLNDYGITVPLAVSLTPGRCHSFLPDDWSADGVPYPRRSRHHEDEEIRRRAVPIPRTWLPPGRRHG